MKRKKHVPQGGNGAKNNTTSQPTPPVPAKKGRKKHGLWGPYKALVKDRSTALKKALRKEGIRAAGLYTRLHKAGKQWTKQEVRAFVLGKKMQPEQFLMDASVQLQTAMEALSLRENPYAKIGRKGSVSETQVHPSVATLRSSLSSALHHDTIKPAAKKRTVQLLLCTTDREISFPVSAHIEKSNKRLSLHVDCILTSDQLIDLFFRP